MSTGSGGQENLPDGWLTKGMGWGIINSYISATGGRARGAYLSDDREDLKELARELAEELSELDRVEL
jgi:hypothetical protein